MIRIKAGNVAAAEAYLRGIERRIAAGLDPKIGSVASLFVSHWDAAIKDTIPARLRNRLGIAVAMQVAQASTTRPWRGGCSARVPMAALRRWAAAEGLAAATRN